MRSAQRVQWARGSASGPMWGRGGGALGHRAVAYLEYVDRFLAIAVVDQCGNAPVGVDRLEPGRLLVVGCEAGRDHLVARDGVDRLELLERNAHLQPDQAETTSASTSPWPLLASQGGLLKGGQKLTLMPFGVPAVRRMSPGLSRTAGRGLKVDMCEASVARRRIEG